MEDATTNARALESAETSAVGQEAEPTETSLTREDAPRRGRRRLRKLAVGSAAALTIGAAMVGYAGPLASPADAVPNCVTTSLDDDGAIDYLTVRNTCSTSQRVKVVIAYNPDFACQTFPPGTQARYQWGYPGRFDGLADC